MITKYKLCLSWNIYIGVCVLSVTHFDHLESIYSGTAKCFDSQTWNFLGKRAHVLDHLPFIWTYKRFSACSVTLALNKRNKHPHQVRKVRLYVRSSLSSIPTKGANENRLHGIRIQLCYDNYLGRTNRAANSIPFCVFSLILGAASHHTIDRVVLWIGGQIEWHRSTHHHH